MDRYNDSTGNKAQYLEQTLSSKIKDNPEYYKVNVEHRIANSCFSANSINTKDRLMKDLAVGRINKEDFKYVTQPYAMDDKSMPAELFTFNIIGKNKKQLTGEQSKRLLNFTVLSTNPDNISEYNEQERQILKYYMDNRILSRAKADGLIQDFDNPLAQDKYLSELDPAQLITYSRKNIKTSREIKANKLLKYLSRHSEITSLFSEGFSEYIDTNKQIYAIDVYNNEPKLRLVKSEYFDCARSSSSKHVEDAEWAIELRFLQPHEVIDLYHKELKPEEVKRIYSKYYNNSLSGAFSLPGNEYGPHDSGVQYAQTIGMDTANVNQTLVPVYNVVWHSLKKVGFRTYVDRLGELQEDIVDEYYKPAKGEKIEWEYIGELRRGTKIDEDIFVDCREIESYYSSRDDISTQKLPYVGVINDNPSFVEECKPYQYLYLVIAYRLQTLFATDLGRVLLMDITQIPDKKGWNVKRWMYYLKAHKIAFVDPYSEGYIKRGNNKAALFNQFTSLDLSMGNQINSYIAMLDKLDNTMSEMAGIPPQRRGQVHTSETVGGVERSIEQSAYITEYLFMEHEQVQNRALSALLDTARTVMPNGKMLSGFGDDGSRAILEIDKDFSYSYYDLWVSSASRDLRKIEALRNMCKEALSAGQMTFVDVAKTIQTDSYAELMEMLENSQMRKEQREDQMAQQQNQTQLQIKDMEVKDKEAERAFEDQLNIRDNSTKVYIKQLEIMSGGEGSNDPNDEDGVITPIELKKLEQKDKEIAIKEMQAKAKVNLEKLGLMAQMQQHQDKMEMEQKKLNKPRPSAG